MVTFIFGFAAGVAVSYVAPGPIAKAVAWIKSKIGTY